MLSAFIVTVGVGFVGSVLFDTYINWPDGGVVLAVATMGIYILKKIK